MLSLALIDHSSRGLPQEPDLLGLPRAVQQPLGAHVPHWSWWGGSRCRSPRQPFLYAYLIVVLAGRLAFNGP